MIYVCENSSHAFYRIRKIYNGIYNTLLHLLLCTMYAFLIYCMYKNLAMKILSNFHNNFYIILWLLLLILSLFI